MVTSTHSYTSRLPYGFWFNEVSGTETIFDRGYRGIASRTLEEPWRITMHAPRLFVPHSYERWFYKDTNSPVGSLDAEKRCEAILARFVLGRDVRSFLMESLPKGTPRGRYLTKHLRPKFERDVFREGR